MSYRPSTDFPSEDGVPGVWWHTTVREPGFLRDVPPPSAWEDLALAHIERHIAREDEASRSYEAFAEVEDPQVKYLAAMIATDEHRHHRLLSDIARALRSMANDRTSDSVTAKAVTLSSERQATVLEETLRLLALEEDDAGDLKRLRHELHPAPDEAIWPLLVEIMELDTEKHIRILKAIEHHLTRERWPH